MSNNTSSIISVDEYKKEMMESIKDNVKISRKDDEYILHVYIADYVKLQYPKALLNVDLSGIRLPIGLARKAKRLRNGRGYPDLVIYDSSPPFSGLFFELKAVTPYLSTGKLSGKAHIQEQYAQIKRLRNFNYFAAFVWTFEMAVKLLDIYFSDNFLFKDNPQLRKKYMYTIIDEMRYKK